MAWPTARRKSARVRTPPTNTSATTMTTSAGSSSSTAACGAFVDAEQQQTQQTYKCRRVEHTTYAALRHELLAYMEAACEAYVCGQQQQQHEQQQHEQYIDNGSSHSHQRLRHNDNEEEEEQVEAAAVYAHPQHSNNNNSDNVHDSRRPRRRDGASHATALAYVCAALRDAYRVLHACWTFRGSPHDAFEPRHALCPLTEQLLLSYGRHTRTPDARYLVLCGGVEQLPWVACAMTAMRELLRRYERQQQQQQQLPYEAAPRVLAALSSPQLARRVVVVERVVVLNCRSFGWLSGDGSEDYAASARLLRAIDRALTRRVAALCATTTTATTTTRAGSTPAPRHRRHDNDDDDDDERSNGERADASQQVRVLLLLGDAMVMDGGVPALDVAARGEVYVTHMAYGRGLACIVSQPPPSTSSTFLPSASSSTTTSPLCAVAGTHSAMPHVCDDDDENRDGGGSGSDGARAWHLPPPASPLPLHARRRGDGDGIVSCGERSGAGVAAQAVLLTLRGPLLVHVQFTAEYDAVAMATATASTAAMASCRLQQQQQQLGQHEVHTSSSFVLHDDNNDDSRRCCYGALSPALLDMAEWLLQMLQAPQPVLVVEWQLQQQQQQQQQQSGATASTTRRQTSSQVLRLLAAYAACARGGAAGSVHDAVAMVQHTLHPLPLAHTCQQQPQHDVDDDAAARPLLLARDCDVALEDTRVVPHTDKMLLTTLCVHAHV